MFDIVPNEPQNAAFAIRRMNFTTSRGAPMYIRVWLYRVMFGWRVYACCEYEGERYPHPRLDWNLCAGKSPANISILYNIVCGMMIRDLPFIKEKGSLPRLQEFSRRPIPESDEWSSFVEKHIGAVDTDNVVLFTHDQLHEWLYTTQ